MQAFFKRVTDTAFRGAVFGIFSAIFLVGIAYALTYTWSDPSSLRDKAATDPLLATDWNKLVGNMDNLNERLTTAESTIASLSAAVPAGVVVAFNGTACPSGWTEAAGGTVPAGTGGSGALDLRGEFIRGWDHGKGTDSGRTFGSWQADDFKSHAHTHDGAFVSTYTLTDGTFDGSTIATGYDREPVSGTINPTGGSETRPKNVALLYCVKN